MAAENREGSEVSYAVVAVLRLQGKAHRQPLPVPWVHNVHTKEQGQLLGAMGPS